MSGDFPFRDSTKQGQCSQCGRWSGALPANSPITRALSFAGALEVLHAQGWVTFTGLDHRLVCLCDRCKADWSFDPVRLHEVPIHS